jgi:hypothetical protein
MRIWQLSADLTLQWSTEVWGDNSSVILSVTAEGADKRD